MRQWFRAYRDEDDVWFYFELDDDGFVQRQVELEGPQREANAACSLQEWEDALRTGTVDEYHETYGMPQEWSVRSSSDYDLKPSTEAEFEGVWRNSRRSCEAGSRSRPDPSS